MLSRLPTKLLHIAVNMIAALCCSAVTLSTATALLVR
jgi:hypothetical protein